MTSLTRNNILHQRIEAVRKDGEAAEKWNKESGAAGAAGTK